MRDLPDLGVLHPCYAAGKADNRSERVLPLLRETAERVRRDTPVAFYSMRQVAAFSGAPMKAVVRAFRRLQAEGVLTCLRGSRTLVTGRKRQPMRPVRGVVGLPVYLPSFADSTGWQEFFPALEEELRRHDYVADFVFFRSGEDKSPDFVERLLRHQLDILVWYAPPSSADQAMAAMRDAGVRVVAVGGAEPLACHYGLVPGSVEAARVFRGWVRSGVREIRFWVAPGEANLWVTNPHSGYDAVAADCGLGWTLERVAVEHVPARVAAVPGSAGVLFQDGGWLAQLLAAHPAALRTLCARHRVLLADDRPWRPVDAGRGLAVDKACSTLTAVARRIADDIASGKAWTHSRPVWLHGGEIRRLALGPA